MARPLTPKDVLGVPALPPAGVAAAGNRFREQLGKVHRAMAPPPVSILEGLFGLLDHRVLVALCEAGIPEAVTGPVSIAELARRVDADPEMLERLLRFAASRGWVRFDRRGRVKPTRVTQFLRPDHPGGWHRWVEFAGGAEVVAAVQTLGVTPATGDAFAAANGAPFFEWMAAHPDRWAVFDGAMAAGGQMHALGLAAAVDWTGTRAVCDVGGGTGALAATLLELLPGVEGTVFDLPQVIERAVEHPRLTAVGGDAFEQVPGGFDTYLLVNVLHDWDDAAASRILDRVAVAMDTGSRLIVVDSERTAQPRPDLATSADVLMAALTPGGKERDAAAFAELGRSAGLVHDRTVRLASGDVAHQFSLAGAVGAP
jgi:hypothetical protein